MKHGQTEADRPCTARPLELWPIATLPARGIMELGYAVQARGSAGSS